MILLSSWLCTTIQLHSACSRGVFTSAEEGMRALITRNYIQPEKVQIIYAGTNSFDGSSPHIWYVVACVWGESRADGSKVGSWKHDYDQPGFFFLNTKDGWVWVNEGAFPVYLGFWMRVFGMAGPGSAHPSTDWSSLAWSDCEW